MDVNSIFIAATRFSFWFVCLFFVNKLRGILFLFFIFFKKATLEPGAKYDGIGPKLTGFLSSPGRHR